MTSQDRDLNRNDLSVGTEVTIVGLKSEKGKIHNGKIGVVSSPLDPTTERYAVKLQDGEKMLSIKPSNLRTKNSKNTDDKKLNDLEMKYLYENRHDMVSKLMQFMEFSGKFSGQRAPDNPRLFEKAPPQPDCEICMLPLPLSRLERDFQYCCGKSICQGCLFGVTFVKFKETMSEDWLEGITCPFCRAKPVVESKAMARCLKRHMKRGNANAFTIMGECTYRGTEGFRQDAAKGKELLEKGAELGDSAAYGHLGDIHADVDRDAPKAMKCWETGALMPVPNLHSRHRMGMMEWDLLGSTERAVMHWRVAAEAGAVASYRNAFDQTLILRLIGYKKSMTSLMEANKTGHITKDDLSATLQAYKESVDSMSSLDRKRAVEIRNSGIFG